MGTKPVVQVATQLFPYKFKVVQLVQLPVVTEQVLQSPVQATATPEMLTKPDGVVDKQVVLK